MNWAKCKAIIVPGVFLLFCCGVAQGAHTSARLLVDSASVRPGETLWAGIHLKMDKGWHTYWKNPGAAGIATEIQWELPAGVTAGQIQWPLPEKLIDKEMTSYIYSGEVLLLVPLKVAATRQGGEVRLKGKVSWLECEVQCVPGEARVEAVLNVDTDHVASADAPLFDSWRNKLPEKSAGPSITARWQNGMAPDKRWLLMELPVIDSSKEADFFPYPDEKCELAGPTEISAPEVGKLQLRKAATKFSETWPKEFSGVLIEQTQAGRRGFELTFAVADAGQAVSKAQPQALQGAPPSLWKMLVYGFLGGLILNIMPCVLPVIALKILGFVGQSREEPRRVRLLGLVYALGIFISFLALAGLVIGVKAAGYHAGWGMQFGNAKFLVVLTVLVTIVALNLFGLFEVTPGSRVMSTAGAVASKHGFAGAFFNGVLATILATPCTAPFLGAALGFAFAQPASLIVLTFGMIAAGLAFPYVVLSWNPIWLRFLPKPGAWMQHFKVAMGFPMLATAVWLFSLTTDHYGERSWWLGIFLVVVAMAAWMYGRFVQSGGGRPALAFSTVIILLLSGYVFVVEGKLHWREALPAPKAGELVNASGGVQWQRWSAEAVAAARAAGRPVLVDFTARWCLTCNTIVKPALESNAVKHKLQEVNAAAFLGDYTSFPPEMTKELNRYGRAGVPLVLVFPPGSTEPPIVLPEAITPGMVVDALEKARQERTVTVSKN